MVTIIAFDHYLPADSPETGKVLALLKNRPKAKIFVETFFPNWGGYLNRLSGYPPYLEVADSAIGLGHEIVPLERAFMKELDKKMTRERFDEYPRLRGFPPWFQWATLRRYAIYNLRERSWAHKLRNAGENDIILLHPNHAKNLQRLLGKGHKIVWISKVQTLDSSRLRKSELANFKTGRREYHVLLRRAIGEEKQGRNEK